MSGTLTITYTVEGNVTGTGGYPTVVSENWVGGPGDDGVPERTLIVYNATINGRWTSIVHLIGGAGDDVLAGDANTNHIEGGVGNDTVTSVAFVGTLEGQAGDDWLRGGASYDDMIGGSGDDTLDGGAGFDLAIYTHAAAHAVNVDLRITGPQDTGEGRDVLTGIEGIQDGDDGPGAFADTLTGDGNANLLTGAGGDDVIYGLGGDDTIIDEAFTGVDGDGYPLAPAENSSDYLRGGDGNDLISGGDDFDDLNGNQGNDTVHGDEGDDWVVGGKDQDLLYGDEGADIVLGNLGNDTCDGGAGNDLVRGGQGDDSVSGGAGDDWLSGDRGSDTVSGGAGADVFHSFTDAGLDRVLDFNRAEGDRVELDPGTTYTVSQVGADVVIDMTGGGQMVLAGVSMASLTGEWIFTA